MDGEMCCCCYSGKAPTIQAVFNLVRDVARTQLLTQVQLLANLAD